MWHVMCRYERIPAMTSHWEKADCHFNYIIVNNVLPQIHPYCRLNLYCKGRKYSVPTYERLSHSLPLKPFKEVFLPCDSAGHLTLQDKDILTVNGNSLPEQCVGRGGRIIMRLAPRAFSLAWDWTKPNEQHHTNTFELSIAQHVKEHVCFLNSTGTLKHSWIESTLCKLYTERETFPQWNIHFICRFLMN